MDRLSWWLTSSISRATSGALEEKIALAYTTP